VPKVFGGMYAPLGILGSQTCQKTARLRHPRGKMQAWETAINHYLRTGNLISGAGWE